MVQNGTRVKVSAGSFLSEPATVVGSRVPFIVCSIDRKPEVQVAVLFEDVRFVTETETREQLWKRVL